MRKWRPVPVERFNRRPAEFEAVLAFYLSQAHTCRLYSIQFAE